jgi:hypothetical protein
LATPSIASLSLVDEHGPQDCAMGEIPAFVAYAAKNGLAVYFSDADEQGRVTLGDLIADFRPGKAEVKIVHIVKAWSGRNEDEIPLCGSSDWLRTAFPQEPPEHGYVLCSDCVKLRAKA